MPRDPLVYAMTAWLVLAGHVHAHNAPSGWSYPTECCAGHDCREVADNAIVEEHQGYVIQSTREFVGYNDSRVKDSPDGHLHWCSVEGSEHTPTVCLFVPPRGL
jgi:hypothetical protein